MYREARYHCQVPDADLCRELTEVCPEVGRGLDCIRIVGRWPIISTAGSAEGVPMSVSISKPRSPEIIYPDSDGEPMAENTLQFRWIVTIKEGLERVFHDRPDVFVAGDLLWYPVEGDPKIRRPPTPWSPSAGPRDTRLLQAMGGRGSPPGRLRGPLAGQSIHADDREVRVLQGVRGRGILPLRPRHLPARRLAAGREQARRDRRDERLDQPADSRSASTPRRASSASSVPTADGS